ncbi:12610_t:CDS:2 [Gigaspora rosea]|nr:12610_t:CDS:2 [Gigaspora rosea]
MVVIPTYIEKTLAKLKAQIEKAKIEGAYIVSSQQVIYTAGEQSQPLPIEKVPLGDTWENKVTLVCRYINPKQSGHHSVASLAQQKIEEVLGMTPLARAR